MASRHASSANMSKISSTNISESSLYSKELVIILSIYEIIIIIFCLIGYALIIFAMVFNSKLRSICNFFILSMGLADGLIATIIIPVSQGVMLQTLHYHSVGACEFVSNLNLITVIAVALNLCACSLERFFVIAFPFRHQEFLTRKRALSIIVAIWFYALIVGLLPQFGWSGGKTLIIRGQCVRPLDKNYLIFNTVLHFCLPAVLMIITNGLVYRIASNQAKRIYRIRASANQASFRYQSNPREQSSIEVFRINYRAAKRISIIVGAYLICWVPQMATLLLSIKIGFSSIPTIVFFITIPLQYTSSAVNPCIFCLLNKEIRKTLIRELKARFPIWVPHSNERPNASETALREDSRGFSVSPRLFAQVTIEHSESACYQQQNS
ncbi:octopamine receptor beta-2R-like [Actinia tenebrosa]|uniref:Octopamine receptor beta-2R-like n=1 Tax=Actinia tenebrosa TaxID=6105 RepID=A0A6P8I4C5_ACTTE|nr:octopamine receptor beta-2R-like [Actinia tenebrosa]